MQLSEVFSLQAILNSGMLTDSIGYSVIFLWDKNRKQMPVFVFYSYRSMLMRDAFAALLRDGEFASQFHLRPLAIPRLTDRGAEQ